MGGVENYTTVLLNSDITTRFNVRHCNTTKGRPKQTQGKFDFGNLVWAFRHFRLLKRTMREHRADLVYLPIASTKAGFLRDSQFVKIVNRTGKLCVGHVHGGDFDNLYQGAPHSFKRYITGVLNRLDTLLPLGSQWEAFFRQIGVTGLIRPAPATIREEVYDAGMKVERSCGQPDTINVLFVGQIGKRKGVFDILDAAPQVHAANPRVFFHMVGPEEFAGEWSRIIERYESGNMRDYMTFPGARSGPELLQAYEDAHMLILPSYFEGQPAVLLEAGAYGLPVVTTLVGAVGDIVEEGLNGYLIQPGDSKTLADRIVTLASDPFLRVSMGSEHRRRIQAFHPREVARKVGDAIAETLDGARPHR